VRRRHPPTVVKGRCGEGTLRRWWKNGAAKAPKAGTPVKHISGQQSSGLPASGLSQQYAAAPAGIQPAEAGTPVKHISGQQSSGLPASGLSQQYTAAPAGIPPAKAGTPVRHISGLISQIHQPGLPDGTSGYVLSVQQAGAWLAHSRPGCGLLRLLVVQSAAITTS
jgi:hypothetical protein